MNRYSSRSPLIRPHQGDIYQDVTDIQLPLKKGELDEVHYPYAVVLTQDCDLESDHRNRLQPEEKQDKFIPSILLAPAYLEQRVKDGIHLKDIGQTMESWNSKRWSQVKKNENKRYHFLEKNLDLQVPDLVVDFKHYFTVSREVFVSEVLNDAKFVASLNPLYREELSQRFVYYLARIGLPDEQGEVQQNTAVSPAEQSG